MKTRDVVFYSEGAKMAVTIYLPDDYKEGEKRAAVLCNSGWTGVNKCYPALYARALTAYGFVFMGFDYRGFKPSEDVHPCLPKYTTLETEVEDIANAFLFLASDMASYITGDDRIYDLLVERFAMREEKRALFASYLAKLGDDRAIPMLKEAAQSPDINYLDYVEVVNAIEELGGERPPEREFSGDPYYESLRRV